MTILNSSLPPVGDSLDPTVRPTVHPTVRPVRPTDGPALHAFGRRCSPASLLHRFLSPMNGLPAAHVGDVVHGRNGMASVVAVTADDRIVGLASAAPSTSGPTELAVIVEDEWQRGGVGRALVRRVVRDARRAGVTELAVVVESTRPGLVRALTPLGPSQRFLDGPTLEARFEIT